MSDNPELDKRLVLPEGWTVEMQDDPPFPNQLAVLISPKGLRRIVVKEDDPLVWDFLNFIAKSCK